MKPISNYRLIKADLINLSLLMAIGFFLRIYEIAGESLWFDEIEQIGIARHSWWETITQSVVHRGNTPFDYLITHFTLYFGDSETILRFPAVLWGVLTIAALYFLGLYLTNRRIAFLAAFLLMILPIHIYYSREVRFYSIATLVAVLSLLSFAYAIRKNTRTSWVIFGIINLIGLYAHYYFIFFLLIYLGWILFQTLTRQISKNHLVHFIATSSVIGVLFLPWIVYDLYFEQVFRTGFFNMREAGFSFSLSRYWSSFLFPFEKPLLSAEPNGSWFTILIWSFFFIGLFVSIFPKRQISNRKSIMLAGLLALLGSLGTLTLDIAAQYFFAHRQMLIYSPLIVFVSAFGINELLDKVGQNRLKKSSNFILQLGLITVILALSLFSLKESYLSIYNPYEITLRQYNQDWRSAANFVAKLSEDEDFIVTNWARELKFYLPDMEREIIDPGKLSMDHIDSSKTYFFIVTQMDINNSQIKPLFDFLLAENPPEIPIHPNISIIVYTTSQSRGQIYQRILSKDAYAVGTLFDTSFYSNLIENNLLEEVLEIIDEISEKKSINPRARGNIFTAFGTVLLEHSFYNLAENYLYESARLVPGDSRIWSSLADAYREIGNLDSAIEAYQKSIQLAPDRYWPQQHLAQIFVDRGKFEDAVELFESALELGKAESQRMTTSIPLTKTYAQMGDTDKACQLLIDLISEKFNPKLEKQFEDLGCDSYQADQPH